MVPICDLYGLPMSVLYGTVLQNPCQSNMGCPYWTHIKSRMGPLLVLYYLLAGMQVINIYVKEKETQGKVKLN